MSERKSFSHWLSSTWYQPHPIRWLLWPLSILYRLVSSTRRMLYKLGCLNSTTLNVPVIIVGNISVGGTGKSPFVIWLAEQLKLAGFKPGIISRGYGGKAADYPRVVTDKSNPNEVGDEPLLISRRTQCPIVVSPIRVEAGKHLLSHFDCDIIISDDGLQHLALNRDLEIVIIDGQRQFGNQYCLPAGPLREPLSRLNTIDFIVYNTNETEFKADARQYKMALEQLEAINLLDPTLRQPLSYFINQTLHAVAGIGNPDRFFNQLAEQKLRFSSHAFNDHHAFIKEDFNFDDNNPILMTEKDAVKCQHFAQNTMWYVPIEAQISPTLIQQILKQLAGTPNHG